MDNRRPLFVDRARRPLLETRLEEQFQVPPRDPVGRDLDPAAQFPGQVPRVHLLGVDAGGGFVGLVGQVVVDQDGQGAIAPPGPDGGLESAAADDKVAGVDSVRHLGQPGRQRVDGPLNPQQGRLGVALAGGLEGLLVFLALEAEPDDEEVAFPAEIRLRFFPARR